MDAFWWAQIVSAISSLIFIASVQLKDKRHIVYMLIVNTLVGGVSLALLNAWSGFTTNLVSLLPALYVYHLDKHHRKTNMSAGIPFMMLQIICWFIVFIHPDIPSTWFDIFPLIGGSLYIFSLFLKRENQIRRLLLWNTLAWMVYFVVIGQFTGLAFSTCFVISDLVALHRFSRGHKKAHRAVHHWWQRFRHV